MAARIKMLRERMIPVHYLMGEVGEIYKVNTEVAEELVAGGDAEYMDREMMPEIKEEKPKEEPKMETAMAESEENAMLKRGRPKKYGRRR
jgi:hypothetical protein